ncbi:MAG: tetratricopeptide repeat protein [Planctomycetota bacterium]|nr:tetratricopeptide repeat protein [Planctomycetota bacterium]
METRLQIVVSQNRFLHIVLAACSCLLLGVASGMQEGDDGRDPRYQGCSLLGRQLVAPEPSPALLQKYHAAKQRFEKEPSNADLEIWLGRFTAYQGLHRQAIEIYSRGIQRHPADARFLRHRGHRHISLRQWEQAIVDLRRASQLVAGKPDQLEPDGIPNAKNRPVSSLHTNIWYHLGLAYYLKNDLPNAVAAYRRGLAASQNDDMRVAFTHWLYMSYRQMGKREEADRALASIHEEMDVIESFDYYELCLFYKGRRSLEEMEGRSPADAAGASDALRYGLANWHLYQGEPARGRKLLAEVSESSAWSSFGCIAAEACLQRIESR